MKNSVTIQFSSAEDAAWFARGVEMQLANRERQIAGATVGLMVSALIRAKRVKSNPDSETLKKIRQGKPVL